MTDSTDASSASPRWTSCAPARRAYPVAWEAEQHSPAHGYRIVYRATSTCSVTPLSESANSWRPSATLQGPQAPSSTSFRDAGAFVRATAKLGESTLEVDLVHDSVPDLAPSPLALEGVMLRSIEDLRASKLTCILSRSEPRDLVDLLFLARAGYPPENDLPLAAQKDAGIDPAVLAWLLSQFPVEPLPEMLQPLDPAELRRFRDGLAATLKARATPGSSD